MNHRRIITALLLCFAVSTRVSAQDINNGQQQLSQKDIEKAQKQAEKEAAKAEKEKTKAEKQAAKEAAKAQKQSAKETAKAQQVDKKGDKLKTKEQNQKQADELPTVAPSAQQTVKPATVHPPVSQADVARLESQLKQKQAEIDLLRQQLSETKLRQEAAEERLRFVDSTALRLANSILSQPLDMQRVADAIMRLDRVTTPVLQKPKQRFRALLESYPKHYDDVKKIVSEVNKDSKLRNPYYHDDTARNYINRLRQTDYYRNVYSSAFYIPWLNKLIDSLIAYLQVSANNTQQANFPDPFPNTK